MITKKRKVANISMSRLLAPANALIRLVTFIAKKLCYNLFDVIHEASSVTLSHIVCDVSTVTYFVVCFCTHQKTKLTKDELTELSHDLWEKPCSHPNAI